MANPWVTFEGLHLNDQKTNINVPTFMRDDFVFTPNSAYDPNSRGGSQQWREYSDTNAGWEWVPDGTNRKGTWELTPEKLEQMKAHGWDLNAGNNIGMNSYTQGGEWQGFSGLAGGMGDALYDPDANPLTGVRDLKMKNSASTALNWQYQIDPTTGAAVPVYSGGDNMITNHGEMNRKALAAFSALVGAGVAIPAAAGALGGGAAGGAGSLTELGVGGAGYTGSTAATGGATALTGAETASTLSQIANAANYAGKGLNVAGKLTGNEALSKVGGITSALTGGYSGLDSLYSGANSGNLFDMLKGAYGTYGAGTKLYDGLVAGDDPTQARSGRMTPDEQRFYGHTQSGQGASAPSNWLDKILGVGAGVNSEIQNRETFTNLNNLFSRREEVRAPLEQKLLESYQNPGSFLEGADYQASARVANDKLLRRDAGRGGLSNDVDRERLMRDHAMKSLGDYRAGLNQSLGQQQLPYEIFRDAQTRNAARGSGVAGGIGYSGATQGILDLLQQSGVTNPSTIKSILSAFETQNDPYGPPVLPGDGHGGFSYGDFDMPTTDYSQLDWSNSGANIDWNNFNWENAGDLGFFDW